MAKRRSKHSQLGGTASQVTLGVLVGGVAIVGGLAYWFWSGKKTAAPLLKAQEATANNSWANWATAQATQVAKAAYNYLQLKD